MSERKINKTKKADIDRQKDSEKSIEDNRNSKLVNAMYSLIDSFPEKAEDYLKRRNGKSLSFQ